MHCFPLTVLGFLTPDRSWLFYRFTATCIDDCTTVHVLHGRKVKIGGEGRGRRREVAYEKLWWSLACVLACVIAVHSFTHAHVQLMLVSVLINIALFCLECRYYYSLSPPCMSLAALLINGHQHKAGCILCNS